MMSTFSENASTTLIRIGCFGGNNHAYKIACPFLLLVFSISSGCSTLLGRSKGPLDNLDTKGLKQAGYTFGEYGTQKPLTTEDGSPAIVLEVNNGKRHFEKIPLVPGQSLFIADLIRDAKLQKKIGRIKTTILRPNGKNMPPVRLDVDFDDSGKSVMEGQNYSLRAGDHVVVRQDDRSVFAGMVPEMPFMKR
jgi:hypothetical protein